MNTNEKELIKLSKHGNVKAFEELVSSYQKKVINMAYSRMGNIEDACDIAQEVFVKVYKSIDKYNETASFSTWIYKITYNTCLDEIRKRKRRHDDEISSLNKDIDDNGSELQISDESSSPEVLALEKERNKTIVLAIESLPEDQKAVIMLRDIDGHSYDEIARILECSLGTVKSRISRARLALKNILSLEKELL